MFALSIASVVVTSAVAGPHFIARRVDNSAVKDVKAQSGSVSATDAEFLEVRERCQAACGSGVDSSCVPKCQTEMFACMDHDRLTAAKPRVDCQAKVVEKYNKFGADWNATHQFLAGHVVTTEEHKLINSQCHAACGAGVDSTCVPKCEIALYACIDYASHTDERKQCNDRALKEAGQFGKNWDANRILAQRKHHVFTASERKAIHFQCKGACGTGVDSSCLPSCETEMFACIDRDVLADRKQCTDEVLEKYMKFAAKWHLQLKKVKATKKFGELTVGERKAVKTACAELCGSDSQCVTGCEADMYACIKETLPGQDDERAKCKQDVESKYSK